MMFLSYTAMVCTSACNASYGSDDVASHRLQMIVMAVQYQRVGVLVLLMAVVPTVVVFVVFW